MTFFGGSPDADVLALETLHIIVGREVALVWLSVGAFVLDIDHEPKDKIRDLADPRYL